MYDLARLDAFIQARIGVDRVPGLSVAVVKGDRVHWTRGFGMAT